MMRPACAVRGSQYPSENYMQAAKQKSLVHLGRFIAANYLAFIDPAP